MLDSKGRFRRFGSSLVHSFISLGVLVAPVLVAGHAVAGQTIFLYGTVSDSAKNPVGEEVFVYLFDQDGRLLSRTMVPDTTSCYAIGVFDLVRGSSVRVAFASWHHWLRVYHVGLRDGAPVRRLDVLLDPIVLPLPPGDAGEKEVWVRVVDGGAPVSVRDAQLFCSSGSISQVRLAKTSLTAYKWRGTDTGVYILADDGAAASLARLDSGSAEVTMKLRGREDDLPAGTRFYCISIFGCALPTPFSPPSMLFGWVNPPRWRFGFKRASNDTLVIFGYASFGATVRLPICGTRDQLLNHRSGRRNLVLSPRDIPVRQVAFSELGQGPSAPRVLFDLSSLFRSKYRVSFPDPVAVCAYLVCKTGQRDSVWFHLPVSSEKVARTLPWCHRCMVRFVSADPRLHIRPALATFRELGESLDVAVELPPQPDWLLAYADTLSVRALGQIRERLAFLGHRMFLGVGLLFSTDPIRFGARLGEFEHRPFTLKKPFLTMLVNFVRDNPGEPINARGVLEIESILGIDLRYRIEWYPRQKRTHFVGLTAAFRGGARFIGSSRSVGSGYATTASVGAGFLGRFHGLEGGVLFLSGFEDANPAVKLREVLPSTKSHLAWLSYHCSMFAIGVERQLLGGAPYLFSRFALRLSVRYHISVY